MLIGRKAEVASSNIYECRKLEQFYETLRKWLPEEPNPNSLNSIRWESTPISHLINL